LATSFGKVFILLVRRRVSLVETSFPAVEARTLPQAVAAGLAQKPTSSQVVS
jgi:hypothetical protein